MSVNFPVIAWQPVAFGGMQAVYNLSASLDNNFYFKLAGTDTNGNRVIPEFLIIDNLNNNSTVRVVYGPNIYSVAPYSRKKFPIAPNLDIVLLTVTLGTVSVGFYNYDPGIPDDLNQYALSSGSAFSTTTWDPNTNTSGLITLDAGNLTGTFGNPGPGIGGVVVGDIARSTGKFYWEPRYILNASFVTFGLAPANYPKDGSEQLGFDANLSLAIQPNGNTRVNSITLGSAFIGTPADGDSIRCAVNLTAALWWCGKLGQNWNNSSTADPATGTGGFSIAGLTAGAKTLAFGCFQQQTCKFGVNFGATPFLNTIPAGFTSLV